MISNYFLVLLFSVAEILISGVRIMPRTSLYMEVMFDDANPSNGAKGVMCLITPMAQKGAVGSCEVNVGLSRNLTVVLFCNKPALTHAM